MKRLPEKLMIAAIILSCGFVMQSEPTEPQTKMKDAKELRIKRMVAASEASLQTANADGTFSKRGERAPR